MIIEHEISIGNQTLFWYADGYGYLQPEQNADVYDDKYFEKYLDLAQTKMGKDLNNARIQFCDMNPLETSRQNIVDVGIGGGAFVDQYTKRGTDVNPHAITWLKERGYYCDIENEDIDWLTFWDVLEHIESLSSILKIPKRGIYLSMPIYKDVDDCLKSKHFKPNEHVWYFTHDGLVKKMLDNGYLLMYYDDIETRLGRESIGSYCFLRKSYYDELLSLSLK